MASHGVDCGSGKLLDIDSAHYLPTGFTNYPVCKINGGVSYVTIKAIGKYGVITNKPFNEIKDVDVNIYAMHEISLQNAYADQSGFNALIDGIKKDLPEDVYLVYTTDDKGIVNVFNKGRERSYQASMPQIKG